VQHHRDARGLGEPEQLRLTVPRSGRSEDLDHDRFRREFAKMDDLIDKETDKSLNQFMKTKIDVPAMAAIPHAGVEKVQLMDWLRKLRDANANAHEGKLFAYVYPTRHDHEETIREAQNMFLHHNALNPIAFPALRKFEVDVVRMAATMLNGDSAVRGTMTSGGSESLLLAVKTYRDRAAALQGITEPEMIMCVTAHAAFEKAAKYFGVKSVKVPFRADYGADVEEIKKRINENTVLIIASAPQFPHGIVDPISEIAVLCRKHKIPLHVDSCVGGFMLPWVRKLGYPVPEFDFRVPEVTSISADVHKYGYSVKGASVILYRNESYRKYQFFSYAGWNGGLYVSSTMLGTRGGGPIAAAWASMLSMGEEGYLSYAKDIMETANYIKSQISEMADLYILGNPCMTVLAFSSKTLNIFTVCDVMEDKFKWSLERQQYPDCVHLTLMPSHASTRTQFIADLKSSIEVVKSNPDLVNSGTAAMYGMMAMIPDHTLVDEFMITLLGKAYS